MRRLLAVAAVLALSACGSTTHTAPNARRTPAAPMGTTGISSAPVSPVPSVPSGPVHVRALPGRLPTPLARMVVVPTGGQLIVAAGLTSDDASQAGAFRIDPRNGRSTPAGQLPVPVHDEAGAVLPSGGVLVIGGGNSAEQDVVQAQFGRGWRVLSHLPQARSDLTVMQHGSLIVVAGGYDGSAPAEGSVLTSSDGRSWAVSGQLPVPVRYAAGTFAAGHFWLFGGEVNSQELTAVQRIDPDGSHARVVAHLPHGLGHAVAVAYGDRILLIGGRTGPDTITDKMWWFDPATSTFSPAGRLPTPLADAGVAQMGSTTYVVGGEAPAYSDRILAITP